MCFSQTRSVGNVRAGVCLSVSGLPAQPLGSNTPCCDTGAGLTLSLTLTHTHTHTHTHTRLDPHAP